MGEVYRAQDTRLGRTVAIKILAQVLADTPKIRQRFEEEARAASGLNHPHIRALYDVGHQDGIDYRVMEYLKGETRATRIARASAMASALYSFVTSMSRWSAKLAFSFASGAITSPRSLSLT